jgi:hypothetical protein
MTAKRLSPQTIGAILCSGVASWTSCGTLALTDGGASRIGVLPSFWWLAAAIGAAAVVALLVGPRRASLLWLSIVALLPWLPVPMPQAALALAGPLRWWIWIAVAAALLSPAAYAVAARWQGTLADPRRAPLVAAMLAAAVYLATAWQVSPQLPGGDEPHYLVIAQSLLKDGDLQIANNHDRGDYREYFDAPLKPHYLALGRNGQIYSVHAPGLAVIVAPVFALFGYAGVLAFLAAVSGIGTALAWRAAWLVTEDAAASWFGWAAVSLSVPFLFQAFTVYPDGFGATVVMAAVLVALRADVLSTRALVATSVALAVLPWLHSRFAVTAAALGVIIAVRQLPRPDRLRRLAAFAAVPVIGAAAWFAFFYAIYGTPNPTAPYGGYTQSAIGNVPRGLTGLLVDQQFGILVNAPVYLCVFAGFVPLVRRARSAALSLAVVLVPYAIAAAFYYMWWGGYVSPARFLASVLLPLAMPAAAWFAASRRTAKIAGLGGLLLSLMIATAIAGVDRGALLYNVRDGSAKVLRWASPLVDLTTGLPSLFQTPPLAALGRMSIWLLAALLTTAVALWLGQRRASAESATLSIGLTAAAAGIAALSTVWMLNGARPMTPAVAGPRLFRAVDTDAHQVAFLYSPIRRVRVADVPPLLPLVSPSWTPRRPDDPLTAVPDPPAGTYTIEATITGDARRLTAGIDRQPGPLWTWDLSGVRGRWKETLTLANDAQTLRVDADPATRAAVRDVSIRAERRLPAHERVSDQRAWRAARYANATVFLLEGRAYVEPGGAWIGGATTAAFAIVGDRGAPLQLFVRNSPVTNTVVLETNHWRQELRMAPREEKLLNVPADDSRQGFVLKVSSAAGARPSEFEPGNEDRRLLGCWIETR